MSTRIEMKIKAVSLLMKTSCAPPPPTEQATTNVCVPCSMAQKFRRTRKNSVSTNGKRNSPRELGNLAHKVEVGRGPIGGRVNVDEGHVVPETDLLLALGNALLLVSLDAIFECSLLAMTFNAKVGRGSV